MRSYSQEKSRQREEELRIEVGLFLTLSSLICRCFSHHSQNHHVIEVKIYLQVDRIQAEIKQLQRNSEESATVSDKLNREVLDVEAAIQQRKSEVKNYWFSFYRDLFQSPF